jgi:hypothetical protein
MARSPKYLQGGKLGMAHSAATMRMNRAGHKEISNFPLGTLAVKSYASIV